MSADYSESEKSRRKPKRTFAVLLSCCLFLAITCASLLAALVLIGKHLVYNSPSRTVKTYNRMLEKSPKGFFRLPNDTVPLNYEILLKPDLYSATFRGEVNITVNVTRNRKDIILHGKNLNIDTVELTHFNDSKVFLIENVKENVDDEVLLIKSKGIITPGLYNLYLKYGGSLANKLVGLYRSKYKNEANGTMRYMVTSKFEPTYARQAFPCFDEPNFKATYKIHLLKPNDTDYIALSNYPQTGEEATPEGTLVHFGETVPMSTYLACFIVSDFNYTETYFENNNTNIPFRVYASPGQLDKTSYAGKVGKACIEYFIRYFDIPYPLPKLDMVAIPDFVSGAMEHWGLVTYRETALLYTETTHSESNKQRVATVVSHELAHSWFGNLVTMDWWDNLWLNEGFASYIEYKGVAEAEPDWEMMDQFLTETLHSVLSLDATQASHPIIQTVITPDQITEVFDTISYNKGASVLRMLESVVGEENFRRGVTNYLNGYKYGNAVTQYLWNHLQTVVGETVNVTEFMDTFTVQMGYPILTMKVEGNKYIITQKRFLKDYDTASKQKSSPLNYKWNVPITYITDSGNVSEIHWLDHTAEQLEIEKPPSAKWIKFNPKQVGYYRVNYLEEDWSNLIANFHEMSSADRAHLLEESFSIAESGDLSYKIPLDMTKGLTNERDYVPWSVASKALQKISMYMHNSQYDTDFKNYVISLIKPIYEELGWNDSDSSEGHVKKLTRVVILKLACVMDYEDALNEATLKFNDWMENGSTVSPDLRPLVYKYGMVNANKETWERLFDKFNAESDANEKLKLMDGLATVRNPSLLTRLIELAKDETYVRSQDYFALLNYISDNPVGTSIVWDYVRENWLTLVGRFTLNDRYLGRLIPGITDKYSTNIKIEEMQQFFAKYPDAGAGASSRKQALETVANNVKWLIKYRQTVEDWIVNNNKQIN